MDLNLNAILLLLVAFQLFFIAVFSLTNRKGKRISNLLLGTFFLILAINVTDILLQIHNVWSFFPPFLLLDDSFLLLFGPLIYLYTLSIVDQSFTLAKKWVHFVPFVVCLLGLLIFYFLEKAPIAYALETISKANLPKGAIIFVVMGYLHGGFYLWLSKRVLALHGKAMKEYHSNLVKINLDWLCFIINSFIGLWFLGVLLTVVPYTSYRAYVNGILFGFIVFLFYFINRAIFKALKSSELLSGNPFFTLSKKKYSGSTLSADKQNRFREALVLQMETEKSYLNPDLTLNDLAKILDLPPKELSQVINQSFGKHFFDFVNSYRIDEAKKLLQDTQNTMTIQEVMYSVGFSSKSSFNTIFKRKTTLTPSQFRLSSETR
ncbi:helix-turn-helix domain-containing protein [Ulvibacterium marinum]|uniref:AraC family transcriptional regulator n=1 Tax=Ulvibacterium marinum TaxID=2419782 RepID=A0A3B0C8Q7_9FLAO|nr:helix-turn-helix transcriptional regulator [Ulvibacterium marinum]RKN82565.1 AraC family transcriptional regulator [Ulvibacterium marinum]